MDNNRKKTLILLIAVIIGTIIAIVPSIVNQLWGSNEFPYNTIFPRAADNFIDFGSTVNISIDPYSGVGFGRGYFPFTFILCQVFFLITNLIGTLPTYYLSYTFFLLCIFLFIIKFLKENPYRIQLALVLTFFSFPIWFLFSRGNIEYLLMLILLLFFWLYNKKKYALSALMLSMAICMKLYPAIFILLFLKNKRYNELFLTIVSSIFIMGMGYIMLDPRLVYINNFFANFAWFKQTYAMTINVLPFMHSIWSGINYLYATTNNELVFLGETSYLIYTIVIIFVSVLLIIYLLYIENVEWKSITVLTMMMIGFPQVSCDYTLIYLLFPILYFLLEKKNSNWENILYTILFALLIIPLNLFPKLYGQIYIISPGTLIKPVIITSIILLIVITGGCQKYSYILNKHNASSRLSTN